VNQLGQPTGAAAPAPYVAMPWRGPLADEPGAPKAGPAKRQVPNLGYYRPTSGIAQGPGTYTQMDPNDPRAYKGPLSMFGTG
jgi:hypothetical protein